MRSTAYISMNNSTQRNSQRWSELILVQLRRKRSFAGTQGKELKNSIKYKVNNRNVETSWNFLELNHSYGCEKIIKKAPPKKKEKNNNLGPIDGRERITRNWTKSKRFLLFSKQILECSSSHSYGSVHNIYSFRGHIESFESRKGSCLNT